MADNKSCEGRVYVCVDCSNVEVVNDIKYDGRTCEECGGHSSFAGFGGIDFASGRDLSVRMDFSESIKGLKAIQREAKKATAALKELEDEKLIFADMIKGFKNATKTIEQLETDEVIKGRNISLPACRRCGRSNVEIEEVTADEKVFALNKMCNDCGWG